MINSDICIICNKTNFKNSNSFTKHIRIHKISVKEYYDKYLNKNNEEFCKCGNKIGFSSIDNGYYKQCKNCNNRDPKRTNKIKQTFLNKYGVENASQVEEFKKKRESTNLERFGFKHAMSNKEVFNKCKETWKKKYSNDNPGKSEDIKIKKKETCLEKYGLDNPSKVKEFRDKRVQTNLDRYGVEYCMQNKEVKEKAKIKMKEKYGTEHALKVPEIKERISRSNSYRWIEDREQRFSPYTESFYNKDLRTLIKEQQNNMDPITNEILDDNCHLHHIDYNKQNDSRENLIFLNHSTHAKTNTNRDEWENILEQINNKIISSLSYYRNIIKVRSLFT